MLPKPDHVGQRKEGGGTGGVGVGVAAGMEGNVRMHYRTDSII